MGEGASPRQWRKYQCPTCHCVPCAQEERCKRARGQSSYDLARQAKQAKAATKASKAAKKKTQPTLSKAKFIKNLKKSNPTISDADIKKALKKAGYNVGCVVLLMIASPVIYGAIELIKWVA